uniref:Uncharacterized protein n=1 Tax=Triticum urartu TaxID=4572 RepID=A0A8R7PG50_TRIUA
MFISLSRHSCLTCQFTKGSPVHIAPACAGSGKRFDHLTCQFTKMKEIQMTCEPPC